ncbi:cyclic pyranopterin monophosphate synthase MoaC [Altererythrobacter aurantiacus]|uniref:Cyclic pyranopterin monophosphate synthase n=1 Tax=Parapontixanthobacter aurantiacus TaxID=1463599 RepID=A0A844ZDR3_9SPHN|nr:cyclic pyranopterin monophosphate synthase MoaC [Parapontixanthobacter aurantiacus]MXO85373.1 cyclic pyranopterin monophosphate synthase MoaC [Parapontixanthobacter aurantiacus]
MAELTHLDNRGDANMVDVGDKDVTRRVATARGKIAMNDAAFSAIREGAAAKGDVLATARTAGIMAAKKTSDLIPLCHPLAIDRVKIDFEFDEATAIIATATVRVSGKTGVEMEALTATTVALLTIYDMAKALDKGMTIDEVGLVSKEGGKSGDWQAVR